MIAKKCAALAVSGLLLVNCASTPREGGFCQREFAACVIGGVLVAATVTALVAAAAYASDERLKRDIRPVETLPNGLQLYSFRYWNDDRTFVGVIAQDLLEDERFRYTVKEDESGYYMVDLAALGLGIEGNAVKFFEASQKAVAEAAPVVN